MKRRIVPAVAAAVGMLILIFDGKTAHSGAEEGIELCIRSVIPSLFPFLVLSTMLTADLSGLSMPLLRPICRLVGIPEGGESLLIVSILGGYPAGAQAVSQLYQQGQISQKNARRLLMFCSNAGPAFLFGIVAGKFSSPWAAWGLFGIGILSALLVGILAPGKERQTVTPAGEGLSLPKAVAKNVTIMAQICAFVAIFGIIMAFLDRWIFWLIPSNLRCILSGLLELTGGCCNLEIIVDERFRFLIAAILLNFGGLCVWLQTASVVGDLGTGSYIEGKILQSLLSGFLAWVTISREYWGILLLAAVAIVCREVKKRGSNSAAVGV